MKSTSGSGQLSLAIEEAELAITQSDDEQGQEGLALIELVDLVCRGADKIAIKKLSKNDRAWAWAEPEGKQMGVYVPLQFRGVFFAADKAMPRRSDKPHILMQPLRARWPGVATEIGRYNYRRFTNKGPEGHFTPLPPSAFRSLAPASFIVIGRKRDDEGEYFDCVTVSSDSVAYAVVEVRFDLRESFQAGVFEARAALSLPDAVAEELDRLVSEFIAAVHHGTLAEVISRYQQMPDGRSITAQAQKDWLSQDASRSFDPFVAHSPGDDLRLLTTDVEFTIYRRHELRYRAAQALQIIFSDGASPTTSQIVGRVVRNFLPLYAVMLGASQQRKTRVGAGFESHIRRMLTAGGVPFEEQMVMSTRRPDFVLPDRASFIADSPHAMVLAAKTTLRERWKQVSMERRTGTLFLATLDEKVTRAAVREMASLNITMVVPEAFKRDGTIVEFRKEPNVQTFKEFFCEEIGLRRMKYWTAQ